MDFGCTMLDAYNMALQLLTTLWSNIKPISILKPMPKLNAKLNKRKRRQTVNTDVDQQ